MFKPLPVEGAPPCKVVIRGEPGTPTAVLQRTYTELLGPIGHFYAKAVQVAALSDLPQVALHQDLPGVRLRFTSNNGQQTVHVELAVPNPKVPPVGRELPPKKSKSFLAVDVLVSSAYYRRGAVWRLPPEPGTYVAVTNDRYVNFVLGGAQLVRSGEVVSTTAGRRTEVSPRAAPALRSYNDNSTGFAPGVTRHVPAPTIPGNSTPPEFEMPGGDQLLPDTIVLGFLLDTEGLGSEAPVELDLYLISETQKVTVDDRVIEGGVYVREAYTNLEFRVRARELDSYQVPAVVEVVWLGDWREWRKARGEGPTFPEDETETITPDQLIFQGGFFVGAGWTEPPGDIVDADRPQMGVLLDETTPATREVLGVIDPFATDRSVDPPQPWDQPVANMTKIATVKWTPSGMPAVPGVATITLA